MKQFKVINLFIILIYLSLILWSNEKISNANFRSCVWYLPVVSKVSFCRKLKVTDYLYVSNVLNSYRSSIVEDLLSCLWNTLCRMFICTCLLDLRPQLRTLFSHKSHNIHFLVWLNGDEREYWLKFYVAKVFRLLNDSVIQFCI